MNVIVIKHKILVEQFHTHLYAIVHFTFCLVNVPASVNCFDDVLVRILTIS